MPMGERRSVVQVSVPAEEILETVSGVEAVRDRNVDGSGQPDRAVSTEARDHAELMPSSRRLARATADGQLVRLIDESLREHAKVKEMVRALRGRSKEAENLESEVNALQEQVEHHVSEEEGEMLPLLEQVMAAERRAELGRRFQAGKRQPGGRRAQRATARRGRAARAGGRRRTARATKGARQKKRARGRRKAQRK